MKKKILVISAGRSDYDRCFPIINNLQNSNKAKLFLYLTQAHHNAFFGNTAKSIGKNFKILKIRTATYPQEINKISTDFKVLLTFY